MEMKMDGEEYSPASKPEETKEEEEFDLKDTLCKEIGPDANNLSRNENDAGILNPGGDGNEKKKKKRNRWRRNKKKSAASGGESNTTENSALLPKVSSNETVCPIPADPQVRCSYCSSTNLPKIRDHVKKKLPELAEIKEEEFPAHTEFESYETEDKMLVESGDNSMEGKERNREEGAEGATVAEVEFDQKEENSKDDTPVSNISIEVEPIDEKESQEKQDEALEDESPQQDQEEHLPSEEPLQSPTGKLSEDELSEIVSKPEKKKSGEDEMVTCIPLHEKTSNVSVIFRIGAAVFESPHPTPAAPIYRQVSSEDQLNPITGLPDMDLESEKDPVLKYQPNEEEASLEELWDGQDQIHIQGDENNNYVSITPYCINEDEKTEEDEQEELEIKEDTGSFHRPETSFCSLSIAEGAISPKNLKVPHPSYNNSADGLMTLSEHPPNLHLESLARRAVAKRENPDLGRIAKTVVHDVISSAEYLCRGNEFEEYLSLKYESHAALFQENVQEKEEQEKEKEQKQELQALGYKYNDLNQQKPVVVMNQETEESRNAEEWVIDPKVIEDAVSEAELAGKKTVAKKTSLARSLKNWFKKRGGTKAKSKSAVKKL